MTPTTRTSFYLLLLLYYIFIIYAFICYDSFSHRFFLLFLILVYRIESVEVEEADGTVNVYPDLTERVQTASVDYIKQAIGVTDDDVTPDQVATLLNRMSLPAKLKGNEVYVNVPITRSGIF